MSMAQPVVGSGLASCCTIVSVFGAVILAIFGYGFSHNWPALMGSTQDPEDGLAVGQTCYIAAIIYLGLIAFCGCQLEYTEDIAASGFRAFDPRNQQLLDGQYGFGSEVLMATSLSAVEVYRYVSTIMVR